MPQLAEQDAPTTASGLPEGGRLGVWFLVLALLIAVIVLVGGIVRISGSGLSIPEWPLINGSLLPPFTHSGWETVYRTYYRDIHGLELTGPHDASVPTRLTLGEFQLMFAIEYTHRLVAALVSILLLTLTVQTLRRAALRLRYGRRVWGMCGLLLLQAVLGGIVVKLDLRAEFVAVHLGIAFAFFALVLWTALQMLRESSSGLASTAPTPKWLRVCCWTALGAVYLQILSGGMVAGTHAGYVFNTWPMMGGMLIPSGELLWAKHYATPLFNLVQNQVLIQFVHRWWAFAAMLAIFVLIGAAMRQSVSIAARLSLRGLASLIVLQIALGITVLVTRVPPVLAGMHLMLGLGVFACLVVIAFELRYGRVDHGR